MTWTPPPGHHPQQQPPPRGESKATITALVLAIVGLTVIGLGALAFMQRKHAWDARFQASADAERAKRAEFMADINQRIQNTDDRTERLKHAKFTSARFDGLDGQCKGKGLGNFGHTLEGSTYADNVFVAAQVGCTAFGDPENNITNMFCCSTNTVPSAFTVGP